MRKMLSYKQYNESVEDFNIINSVEGRCKYFRYLLDSLKKNPNIFYGCDYDIEEIKYIYILNIEDKQNEKKSIIAIRYSFNNPGPVYLFLEQNFLEEPKNVFYEDIIHVQSNKEITILNKLKEYVESFEFQDFMISKDNTYIEKFGKALHPDIKDKYSEYFKGKTWGLY